MADSGAVQHGLGYFPFFISTTLAKDADFDQDLCLSFAQFLLFLEAEAEIRTSLQ